MIPAETILFLWRGTVGIATLNPRLNMDYPLAGDRLRIVGLVLRATFQSPLQLRGVVRGVINGGLYRQVWAQDVINSGLYSYAVGHMVLLMLVIQAV